MGLFDDLVCEHELPDGFDPSGIIFQTKDTPDPFLETYVLLADGRLIHQKSGEDANLDGPVEFYASNWCGSFMDLRMTKDDQPLWSAEYTAFYDHGKLLRIEGSTSSVEGVTHVLRADFDRFARERQGSGLTVKMFTATESADE